MKDQLDLIIPQEDKLKTIMTVLFVLLGILLFATNVQAVEYYTLIIADKSNPTQVQNFKK